MASNQKLTLYDIQRKLNNDFRDFYPLMHLSRKIKVSPANLINGLLILMFMMIINGILAEKIVFFIGFLYPFYKSVECLNHNTRKEFKYWIIYWVIFMGLMEFDMIIRILLLFIPLRLYQIFISGFLIALYYPGSPIIENINNSFIRPNGRKLLNYGERVYKFINECKK